MYPTQNDSLTNTATSKMSPSGEELTLQPTKASGIKLSDSSTPEQVAAVGLQITREIFPSKDRESDLATKLAAGDAYRHRE